MAPTRCAVAVAVKLEVEEFGADECGRQGSSADAPDASAAGRSEVVVSLEILCARACLAMFDVNRGSSVRTFWRNHMTSGTGDSGDPVGFTWVWSSLLFCFGLASAFTLALSDLDLDLDMFEAGLPKRPDEKNSRPKFWLKFCLFSIIYIYRV